PRWDLSAIYPGLGSPGHAAAKTRLSALSAEFLAHLAALPAPGAPRAAFADWLAEALRLEEAAGTLAETLGSFAYASYSTATRDAEAMAELNSVEELSLPLKRAAVLFRKALAARRAEVEALSGGPEADPRIAPLAFHLREELFRESRQMSPELEDLAEDLSRSGGDAWSRLQETVSANASVVWDGLTGERKTVVELRNLARDPDRAVRERAYRLELGAWKSVELPLAAALNGVKGFALTLDRGRGLAGALEKSLGEARLSRAALDALVRAMEESLPVWRRYLKAKARLLGLRTCAFHDLFAPVPAPPGSGEGAGGGAGGAAGRSFTFGEARDFIVGKFAAFDPAMGDFADRAFREGWIDAEPRPGKVGGAYCVGFPEAKAARVLCNFDGGFPSLTTLAHELGHAWHHECVARKPRQLARYPMTLAETASIFAETVVYREASRSAPPAGRLGLLENHLQDGCQVICDILSRFNFERAVFERRAKGEIPAEELCSLMLAAQRETYGEGLDPEALHPYMWAAKGHYYRPDLSFYNFPYAFGLLFGLGLYARYADEGPSFAAEYRRLLAETGSDSAAGVAGLVGFDIESVESWRNGIAVFAAEAAEFEALAEGMGGLNG
ncbi:MAG: M3 family oligoendopeptidase, partial [Spirochaetaceae bacterium]|nr:M3 family oligoendopeptidase [Spirochaetaceae bacterium]